MTQEELDESVCKHVREHFTPKKAASKQIFSADEKKYFKYLVQPKYDEPMSDYDRQITKSYDKKSNRQYNQVPQLKVLSKKDEATAQFVLESGLTKAQLQGG